MKLNLAVLLLLFSFDASFFAGRGRGGKARTTNSEKYGTGGVKTGSKDKKAQKEVDALRPELVAGLLRSVSPSVDQACLAEKRPSEEKSAEPSPEEGMLPIVEALSGCVGNPLGLAGLVSAAQPLDSEKGSPGVPPAPLLPVVHDFPKPPSRQSSRAASPVRGVEEMAVSVAPGGEVIELQRKRELPPEDFVLIDEVCLTIAVMNKDGKVIALEVQVPADVDVEKNPQIFESIGRAVFSIRNTAESFVFKIGIGDKFAVIKSIDPRELISRGVALASCATSGAGTLAIRTAEVAGPIAMDMACVAAEATATAVEVGGPIAKTTVLFAGYTIGGVCMALPNAIFNTFSGIGSIFAYAYNRATGK